MPGERVRFSSLDFIIALDGTLEQIQDPLFGAGLGIVAEVEHDVQLLVREDDALPVKQSHGFDSAQLDHQLHTFLGPRSAQEDLCTIVLAFANVTAQLAGGEPLSPDVVFNTATETYPFGLPNAGRATSTPWHRRPLRSPVATG